jgi:ankyrin repeat protein
MMKKIFCLLTILSLQFQFANQESFVNINDYNQIILKEIINNNYKVVNDLLSKRLINSRSVVDGKPLLIHAVINDRPDMVNLLIRFGAQP